MKTQTFDINIRVTMQVPDDAKFTLYTYVKLLSERIAKRLHRMMQSDKTVVKWSVDLPNEVQQ